MIGLSSIISRNQDRMAYRRLNADNAILIHYDSKEEFRLRSTAVFIWDLMENETSVGDIVSAVSRKYHVPSENIQADIISFLSKLHQKGLVKSDHTCIPQTRNDDAQRLIDVDPAVREIMLKNHIPYATTFVLSYICNLTCSHCYIPSVRDMLSTSEIKQVLDELAELHGIYLRFTGGEPFLRKDILEILTYAKLKRFATAVNTNGFFIAEEVAEELRKIYPMDINISLYGMCPETHERVTRRKGSFETSMRAIELLKSKGINVSINYIVMNHNVTELEPVKAWAMARGIGFQPDYSIFPKRDGDQQPICHRVTRAQLLYLFKNGLVNKPRPALCRPASIKLRIDPDGTVHPCEMLEYNLGNVREKRLIEIWTSSAIEAFRRVNIQNPTKCATCRFKDRCFRCPGFAQLEDGDMAAPSSWACRVSQAYDLSLR